MGPALQAMQEDDTQNPAMLWVREGEAQWTLRSGHVAKSCADCHGEIGNMRGVAARYPAMSDPLGRPLALGGRINQCRQSQQQAPPFAAESRELLARVAERFGLTARGYHRILRVARTIADLGGDGEVKRPHVAEAVSYRLGSAAKG